MVDYYELRHHGILGMKWGVRRYQPYPKGSKKGKEVGQAAKVNQRIGNSSKPKSPEELAKLRAENLQKAREAAAAKRKYDAAKEKAVSEGTATDVLKFKGDLTNKQMQEAVNRLELERKLSTFAASEIKSNMEKVDKVMKSVKTVTEWGKIGTDTYNMIASIYNSTEDGRRDPLPIIKRGG